MKFLMIFIVLSIVNVVFSTVRSILTIKGSKTIASLVSGGYFAFYNVMLIYTVSDFPLWQKCIITFVCNVIGVFIVKLIEEKSRKDKLWKIEVTIPTRYANVVDLELKKISHSLIPIDSKYTLFNFYCKTQAESKQVKNLVKSYGAKYFATESKIL